MRENENLKNLLTREFLHSREIAALSNLLCGEISAVEAYNLAIENVKDESILPILEECRNSHALRVDILQDRMEYMHETALESSGWWGALARFVEGSATFLSDKVALSVLAAGEDYGFSQYELNLKDLDIESYETTISELLPEQGKTLKAINNLCNGLRKSPRSIQRRREDDTQSRRAA
jgi:hypothetical protein